MPPELVDILRPFGPVGAMALVLLFVLKWVGDRVDKWADAAIKQAETNMALKVLMEHMHETLQRVETAIREIQNGRRS